MAKLKVLNPFRDKKDHKSWYKPGQMINISDEARVDDLVKRGLCAVVGAKESGKKSGKQSEQQPSNNAASQNASDEGTKNPAE